MAESGQESHPPRSARISEAHVKQLKAALKESSTKYNELFEQISDFQREEDKQSKAEMEANIQKQLKDTHGLCLKLQREIEVIEHKSKQASKEKKSGVSAFAADFRLTPEEQDIAYEFRAKVMRKIHAQNQSIKKELEMHEKRVNLKKCQELYKKQVEDQSKSQTTLVRLTSVYEKRANQAESKANKLEAQLRESQEIVKKYEMLYESHGGDVDKIRNPPPVMSKGSQLSDVIRKNEVVKEENEKLKKEIARLKLDNAELIKKVKRSEANCDEAQHALGTCEISKQELQKRLEKETKQHRILRANMNNQAAAWLQDKKEMKQLENVERHDQVSAVSPLASKERLYQYPVKKNVDQPRQMRPLGAGAS